VESDQAVEQARALEDSQVLVDAARRTVSPLGRGGRVLGLESGLVPCEGAWWSAKDSVATDRLQLHAIIDAIRRDRTWVMICCVYW
jgi:hypothetical protein